MNEKIRKEKRELKEKKISAVSIILNLTLAIIAFSVLVSFESETISAVPGWKFENGHWVSETPLASPTEAELTVLNNPANGPEGLTITPVQTNDAELIDLMRESSDTPIPAPAPGGGVSAVAASKGASYYTVSAKNGMYLTDGTKVPANNLLTKNLDTNEITTVVDGKTVTVPPEDLASAQSQNLVATSTYGGTGGVGWGQAVNNYFGANLLNNLMMIGVIGGLGALVGGFLGGNGALAGFLAGAGGTFAYQIASAAVGKGTVLKIPGLTPGIFGVGVGVAIFLFTYKKTSTDNVEFTCKPFEPPIGGADCQLCNDMEECSEYTCKSLGQACAIENPGTKKQRCFWKNPLDTKTPEIKFLEAKGFTFKPFSATRPPATGVEIKPANEPCIEAFTPLEFTFVTDEPAKCKIDYNLTTGVTEKESFEAMSFFVGGESLFVENHTEKMALPSPDALNALAPEIKNDGIYTLYTQCQDANGNVNAVPFAIRFCVKAGPDTTPPVIRETSIPSKSPISFNQTSLNLDVYVNEPADCKWSREDKDYDLMENSMACDQSVLDMNERNLYTCTTTLTGLQDRQKNDYFFRCKDQPEWEILGISESARNPNRQSFLYTVIGTQPLNILSVGPNSTIYGATDSVPVFLKIKTDNGFDNGKAFCYYYNDVNNLPPTVDEDYIQFAETNVNTHSQRQDLTTGNYVYFLKCLDLGGNVVYNYTSFRVETDRTPPIIVRAYKDEGKLKIITNEKTTCSYSHSNCNFQINDSTLQMPYANSIEHTAEWKLTYNYYIRCKDEFGNEPNPNECSRIIRPYTILGKSDAIVL